MKKVLYSGACLLSLFFVTAAIIAQRKTRKRPDTIHAVILLDTSKTKKGSIPPNHAAGKVKKDIAGEIVKDVGVDLIGHAVWCGIGVGIAFLIGRIRKQCIKRRYKKIFGEDINTFTIVYSNFTLPNVYDAIGNLLIFPYVKGGRNFNMTSPISLADVKAAQYLSDAFYNRTSRSPAVIPDTSVVTKLDFSYCSVGGMGNDKTNDVLNAANNRFFNFLITPGIQGIERLTDHFVHHPPPNHDIGLIIRLTNSLFPNRIQICVAGLGEDGTSGAGWFLAMKWKELLKQSDGKDFGAVLDVRAGIDESAKIIDFISL
jgi:hypothetical protein